MRLILDFLCLYIFVLRKSEKMKKNILTILLLLTFVFQSASAQIATKPNSPALKAAMTITAEQLKDYLYYVASDEMEGRDTPSRGLDATAKFIALNLKRWGFKPAGDDGTYFQKIALNIRSTDASATRLTIGEDEIGYGRDFFATPAAANVSASPLVFAGNGWFIKAKNLDALRDIDVAGKTVVIYAETNYPAGVTQQDLFSGKYGRTNVDWIAPLEYARAKGAAGLITIAANGSQDDWQIERRQIERGGTSVERFVPEINVTRNRNIPAMTISREAAESLLKGESTTFSEIVRLSQEDTPLPIFALNKSASYTVQSKITKASTQNVVAVWEGSDAILKNEMVAVGAHYDHVGVRPNAAGEDKIWNGADDDGSGTVAVLAMAEALAKSPRKPKRSVLLVWHAGEEKGLWGSRYFNKYPTIDIKQVVAQLNIDMIGRSRKAGDANPRNKNLSGEQEIYVIGSEMMSSKLGAVTKSINDSFLKLNYNYKYDDPKDSNRFFFRSDHFNYAVNGIPIVFWFDGVHEDYHGADDEAEKIDYAKMEQISRTIFLTMWEIADLKERPAIDKQLPKELTER
jgi:hypothetical protein